MPDIFLLGTGIRGTLQISLETLQALDACSVVYVLHDDPDVLAFAQGRGCEVIDAAEFYPEEGLRYGVYRNISDAIVKRAAGGQRVALLVHGHPLFLVSAAEYTMEKARACGLTVCALPAVSSFDTLLTELKLDFGYYLHMYDASTLIEKAIALNPEVPTLIFQVATVMNQEVTRGLIAREVLEPLQEYLLKFYTPEYPCELIYVGTTLMERSIRERTTIEGLTDGMEVPLWKRPTLFLPAMSGSRDSLFVP